MQVTYLSGQLKSVIVVRRWVHATIRWELAQEPHNFDVAIL